MNILGYVILAEGQIACLREFRGRSLAPAMVMMSCRAMDERALESIFVRH